MEQDLFQDIYNKFYPTVYRICCGYVGGNSNLAEDLCQETFIRIWENHDNFKGNCMLSTWIYRIAVNCCLNELRKTKNRIKREQLYEPPIGDSAEKQQTDQQVLMQCIGKLCEGERIIMLLALEELDHESIAQIIGTTNVNIRVKTHRIKEKLRKIYVDNFSECEN